MCDGATDSTSGGALQVVHHIILGETGRRRRQKNGSGRLHGFGEFFNEAKKNKTGGDLNVSSTAVHVEKRVGGLRLNHAMIQKVYYDTTTYS